MRRTLFLVVASLLAGCTPAMDGGSFPQYVAGFNPPPVSDGYTRLVAPALTNIQPGDDWNYCQWLVDPADINQLVVAFGGYQSKGGHHFTLYATKVHEPVGTSRICSQDDMLNITFLGAIGGEGNGSNVVKLPAGLAFPIPKGMALMANAHYLNATQAPFDVQSVADVKISPPTSLLSPVGFVAASMSDITIPSYTPQYTREGTCTATQTLHFFMWGNHMHEYGSSVYSELIHQDGTKLRLATDTSWTQEQTFNTPWVKWDTSAPLTVQPGDKFHVACTWSNNTATAVTFPREMCTASGFVLESVSQTICDVM